MNWRLVSDWAKRRPATLRIADWLGRGRGRLRMFDQVRRPEKAPLKPDLSNWESHELAAAWIGHATVLLRVGGLNIITDPVFSNRVGIGLGLMTAGPTRLLAPALKIRELPRIDLILVSHAHFDHLDRPTLNRLSKQTPVITSQHNSDLIRDLGFEDIQELEWGKCLEREEGLKITACPVRHWGARTFHDMHRGFSAFLIESDRRRVLYGGDTAWCDHFSQLGKVDLAIFGIGAYDPYIQAHASPEQAWDMANQVMADYVLPMHHSTFRLSYEPVGEPIERLIEAAGEEQSRIVIRQVGGQWGI